MKNILLTACAIFLACAPAIAAASAISADALPEAARAFIAENFPNTAISSAEKSGNWFSREYSAKLANAAEICFDASGNWFKIRRESEGLPIALLPKKAEETLEIQFIGSKVKMIETMRTFLKVELFDGRVLLFDKRTHLLISVE